MCAAAVERQYVDSPFGQNHLYRAGSIEDSDHPALMCFHMSPWAAVYYEPFLADMGQDRLAIAVDTPGYGNSDAPETQPEIADYARSMGDVVDALGLTALDLMGDRTGAKIALELARQRPEQVRRLILVSPVVWTDDQLAYRREFAAEVIQEDGSHLVSMWLLAVGLSMEGRSLDMIGRIFYTRYLQHKTLHWGRRAAANYDAREALKELSNPIMVLRPRDDLWTMVPRVQPYLQHPQSHVRDLPDWGFGFLDVKTAEAAALVRAFLGRLMASA